MVKILSITIGPHKYSCNPPLEWDKENWLVIDIKEKETEFRVMNDMEFLSFDSSNPGYTK